jgi:hypothetical protein
MDSNDLYWGKIVYPLSPLLHPQSVSRSTFRRFDFKLNAHSCMHASGCTCLSGNEIPSLLYIRRLLFPGTSRVSHGMRSKPEHRMTTRSRTEQWDMTSSKADHRKREGIRTRFRTTFSPSSPFPSFLWSLSSMDRCRCHAGVSRNTPAVHMHSLPTTTSTTIPHVVLSSFNECYCSH